MASNPPGTGPRRARVEAAVLERARGVLAERGPDGLTLRGLAADLGMAASGVHYYFPARDDLLARLVEDTFVALAAAVVTGPADPPLQALSTAAHGYVGWACAHPDLFDLAHSRTASRLKDRPGLLPAKDRAVRALIAPLLAAFEAGVLVLPPPADRPVLQRQLRAWSRAIGERTLDLDTQLAGLTAYTVVHGHATLVSTGSLPRELLADDGAALLDAHLGDLLARWTPDPVSVAGPGGTAPACSS